MKKVFMLFLALALLLTLCACSSGDSSNAKVELPSNGKKGPSQDLIREDLESALTEIPNAVLTEVSTLKSLTEDTHYEITLQVSAVTTYADWQLECDMSYIKYDQGWMLDDITALFYPPESVHETNCLIEQGVGVGFREVQTFRRSRGRGVSGTPTKSGF